MHVKITATGQVISLDAFYALHPTKTFGGVPSEEQLADEGAEYCTVPPDIPALRLVALAEIDRQAQALYDQSIVNVAIQEEYKAAHKAALAWLADMNLANIPPRIAALANKFGITHEQAAHLVCQKTDEGNMKLELRGAARLDAKSAVELAESPEAISAAVLTGVAAMSAITFSAA